MTIVMHHSQLKNVERALKKFPDDLQVKRALARAYHRGERYKDALIINSELANIKDLSGMFNLGYMYYYGTGVNKTWPS